MAESSREELTENQTSEKELLKTNLSEKEPSAEKDEADQTKVSDDVKDKKEDGSESQKAIDKSTSKEGKGNLKSQCPSLSKCRQPWTGCPENTQCSVPTRMQNLVQKVKDCAEVAFKGAQCLFQHAVQKLRDAKEVIHEKTAFLPSGRKIVCKVEKFLDVVIFHNKYIKEFQEQSSCRFIGCTPLVSSTSEKFEKLPGDHSEGCCSCRLCTIMSRKSRRCQRCSTHRPKKNYSLGCSSNTFSDKILKCFETTAAERCRWCS